MLGSNARGHGSVGWRGWLGCGLGLSAILIWIPQQIYAAIGAFVVAQWRILLTGLVIVGLAVIAASTVSLRKRTAEANPGDDAKPLLREIPGWAIWAGMAVLVAVGLFTTWWLVATYGNGDTRAIEQNRIKLEAIKLAGSVVVGTGGVAALLLAARRQRVSELDLLQRDRVADTNRHDAEERRATELYTSAAEQLASDKAPVRMAGMYALSRLGETHENLRQTIINLLCAYLRMPDISVRPASYGAAPDAQSQDNAHKHLGDSPQAIVIDLASAPLAALTALAPDLSSQMQQERQVRLTAQRLLEYHLRPLTPESRNHAKRIFWSGMDINLAGASLHDWEFSSCSVQRANFRGALFHGNADFGDSVFRELADFNQVRFNDEAFFDDAQFLDAAYFRDSEFHGAALFSAAEFDSLAVFNKTQFQGVRFRGTKFNGSTHFDKAEFHITAHFSETQFGEITNFNEAKFHLDAMFDQARFHGSAMFHGAKFRGDSVFNEAHFYGTSVFNTATFDEIAMFNHVQFHDRTLLNWAYFRIQPIFKDAQARVTLGEKMVESSWPTSWEIREARQKTDQQDRWGRLVLVKKPDDDATSN